MNFDRRSVLGLIPVGLATACAPRAAGLAGESSVVGFEKFAPEFDALVDITQLGGLLSTGHWWAEGPAWDSSRGKLYFTDVPRNIAYSWSQSEGVSEFLNPSGADGEAVTGMREPGANGLLMGQSGELLICNHGRRAVEAMNLETGQRRILCDRFEGKRFNSPNDLVEAADGTIYFSDPPYGLEGLNASPLKEMPFNGVYRLTPDGHVSRIVDDMTFPNGVQLSPDQTTLYVAQSDPDAPLIRAFDLRGSHGTALGGGEIWFDAAPFIDGVDGLPDGMAVSTTGHVFLAGPGGVLVINPQGRCLGRIATGRATANCAFGQDGDTLFMTAGDRLVAIRTKVLGIGEF